MNPEDLLELLYVAANARTPEEKARVAWRASDYLWWKFPKYPAGFCRVFNDICPEKPFVKGLWDLGEREKYIQEMVDNVNRGIQIKEGKSTTEADGSRPSSTLK